MALQKTGNYKNTGVTGNYWRITDSRIVYNQSVDCTLSLYKDAESRGSGCDPLNEFKRYSWYNENFDFGTEDDYRVQMYVKIKSEDSFFTDALDV